MNYYLDPIIKHYFDFNGRATRKQFWMFCLYCFIGSIILEASSRVVSSNIYTFISQQYTLILFLPTMGIMVRRLHDIGKSGWYSSLAVVSTLFSYLIQALGPDKIKSLNIVSRIFIENYFSFSILIFVFSVYFLILLCRDSGPDNEYGMNTKIISNN